LLFGAGLQGRGTGVSPVWEHGDDTEAGKLPVHLEP